MQKSTMQQTTRQQAAMTASGDPAIDVTEYQFETVHSGRAAQRHSRATRDSSGTDSRLELHHFPRWPGKVMRVALLTWLLLLPVAFGGVHPLSYRTGYMITAVTLLFVALGAGRELQQALRPGRAAFGVVLALGALLTYFSIQTLVFYLNTVPHPVSGSVPQITVASALQGLASIANFSAIFILVASYIHNSGHRLERVRQLVVLSTLCIAGIGLVHWFADNGKLFWIFEPDSLFVSARARWPFVNSNHLAWFLLPGFFLLLTRLGTQLDEFSAIKAHIEGTKSGAIVDILSSQRAQKRIIRVLISTVLLIAVLVPLLGTLSRGAWFGLTVGSLLYLTLQLRWQRRYPKAVVSPETEAPSAPIANRSSDHSGRRRRRRRHNPERRRSRWSTQYGATVRALALASFLLVMYLALGDRGNELVLERLEFGLLHSKNDLRWQLLTDTVPMISSYLGWGVGLGGWAHFYPMYMNPLVAGVTPVFLHSEPVQLLAEGGLFATLIVSSALLYGGIRFIAAIRSLGATPIRHLVGLAAAVVGMLAATAFDFQFHIPALQILFAVVLAILVAEIDGTPTRQTPSA